MKIEICGVRAKEDGAEMLVTVKISNGENAEMKKILLPIGYYAELGLFKGKLLQEETFDDIEARSKKYLAVKKGTELLSFGMSSKKKLSYKLRMKGFDREDADAAAEYLASKNVIDEESDAEKLVSEYIRKLWGRKRIYSELLNKGYGKDTASAAVRLVSDEIFAENCILMIKKRCGNVPDDPIEKKRLINSLLRYGYSFSEINSAFYILEQDD